MARKARKQQRVKLEPELAQRLGEMAAQIRTLLYGERGCPEWGTRFSQVEDECCTVGEELSRLLMAQGMQCQADRMPPQALEQPSGEPVQPAGSTDRSVLTPAGEVTWSEPTAYLPQSEKAFFPSGQGAGSRRG